MKKCPFCAEIDLQDEAVRCKHCHQTLPQTPKPPITVPVQPPAPAAPKTLWGKIKAISLPLKIVYGFFIIPLALVALGYAIGYWWITLPFATMVYLWKKSNLGMPKALAVALGVFVLCFSVQKAIWYYYRAPILTILSPADQTAVTTDTVEITGMVKPEGSTVQFDQGAISPDSSGKFSVAAKVTSPTTTFTFSARLHGTEAIQKITLTRPPTAEETSYLRMQAASEYEGQFVRVIGLAFQGLQTLDEIASLKNPGITEILAYVGAAQLSFKDAEQGVEELTVPAKYDKATKLLAQVIAKWSESGKIIQDTMFQENNLVSALGKATRSIKEGNAWQKQLFEELKRVRDVE